MDSRDILKNVVDLSLSTVEVSVSTAHILSGTREVQMAAASMASALEELSASIGDISRTSTRTSSAVEESSRLTEDGMREMTALAEQISLTGQTFESVSTRASELQGVVRELSKVVDLIAKIADHTDILALNAGIEAARAGVHGKGFAVVAEEVKSLSRQTTEATGTIRSQIKQLTQSFGEVINTVSDARAQVSQVVVKSREVHDDFQQINQNAGSISGQVRELSIIISQQREAIDLMASNMATVKDKGDVNLEAVNQLASQTDHSVRLIEDWRGKLALEDIPGKVILLAQADHLLWKKRLLDMAVGRSSLKSSDLTDHRQCRLGKWYYSVNDTTLSACSDFREIEAPHQRVHECGIRAARLFEMGQIEDGMRAYQDLDDASQSVISKLQALERSPA